METERQPHVGGLWVPIITPFSADGSLDEASLRRLAERLLGAGVDGLVALGTTGEPATLSAIERRRVVEICDAACIEAGRSLMVGAGTNSTSGTIDEVRFLAAETAAAAALVVVPYYTRPSAEAVVEHFGIVADASPIPLVMYNIPYRTGRGLDASALLAAATHTNLVGLKQSVGALDVDTLALLANVDASFAVLAGDDAFIAPTVLMGGAGAISAAAHLCTELFVAMVQAARSGDVQTAVERAKALLEVVVAGFAEPSPAVWKGALARRGEIDDPGVRRPMTQASSEAIDRVLVAVAAAEDATVPPPQAGRRH